MARTVQLVEETLRDGQLCLWATRMNTETMLGVARTIDAAGFERACVGSGAAFDTAVKFLHEDPWARLRSLRSVMERTPLEFLVRGRNLLGWRRFPDDVVELLLASLGRAGMRWILVFDGLNDMRNIEHHIRVAKREGLNVAAAVMFTVSPVHTDAYFVDKARQLARYGADTVNFYDASGLLTPARVRTLFPALRQAAGSRVPIELNVHANTGLGMECYVEALRLGADILSTASLPLANGESLPATRDTIRHAREVGLRVAVDDERAKEIDDYFSWVSYRDGKPMGRPVRFDPAEYDRYVGHQLPGGMISNFRQQLSELGAVHRLPEILEEVVRVRQELGYPPMVTPYSQLIGVQSTLNVIGGERYKTIPSELGLYVRGYYGEIPAPVDSHVLDRILGGGDRDPIDPAGGYGDRLVSRIRAQSTARSDEELLLSIFYDPDTLERFGRNRKTSAVDSVATTPLAALVRHVCGQPRVRVFRFTVAPGRTQTSPPGQDLGYGDVLKIARVVDATPRTAEFELASDGLTLLVRR